jgi:hypothetical protein
MAPEPEDRIGWKYGEEGEVVSFASLGVIGLHQPNLV